jgi:hypothetical protein
MSSKTRSGGPGEPSKPGRARSRTATSELDDSLVTYWGAREKSDPNEPPLAPEVRELITYWEDREKPFVEEEKLPWWRRWFT